LLSGVECVSHSSQTIATQGWVVASALNKHIESTTKLGLADCVQADVEGLFVHQLTVVQKNIEVVVAQVATEGALVELVVASNKSVGWG
jgi:hypothetical protein